MGAVIWNVHASIDYHVDEVGMKIELGKLNANLESIMCDI